MPIISVFHGIVIRMYYHEHDPPHFHAEHQGNHASFGLGGKVVAGTLPSASARRMIRRWASLHRAELDANWKRLMAGLPLERIEPLE